MTIFKLTDTDGKEILVNFQNVTHVLPSEAGSVIYTVRESGYFVITVKESLDEILKRLEKQ